MSLDIDKLTCIVCGTWASLMCQRCGEPYCNDVCQRRDWQRHKYFCSIMPPLVKASIPAAASRHEAAPTYVGNKASSPTPILNEHSALEPMVKDLTIGEPIEKQLSQAWREPVMPSEKLFFECRVTYMEKDGSIWVVDIANAERLERLTNNMARSMQYQKSCLFENILVGDLVGVNVDHKMYRGEVIALNASAEVRLIDYGAVVRSELQDMYLPVPRMAEYNAFALRVKLPTNAGVQINKNLTLRLLGSQTPDGIEQVQMKPKMTIPLNLPVQMLAINPEVSFVRTLQHDAALKEPQVALLQIKVMSNLNDDLNARLSDKPGLQFTEPFPEEIRTFFLAARTKQGYRRAMLLDFIEQPMLFLVYEMDEGRVSLTDEVCRIPSELLGHALRVFAVTPAEDYTRSLQQALMQAGDSLCIKFCMENLHSKDKLRTVQASLLVDNTQVCAVRAMTFLGRVCDLGHKYWRESIENGSLVYISHVINYQEICISSVQTKQYEDIFKYVEPKCPPFRQSSDVVVGSLVLVVSPSRGNFRAEITGVENNKFVVRNIDTGSTHNVARNYLRMPCPFIENLPVCQCRVKIKTICNIPSSAVPPNTVALQTLMKLFAQKTEMQVDFEDADGKTVDLLDFSAEPQSLMTRMLPLMFTPVAVELEPAMSLPACPVVAPEPIKALQAEQISAIEVPPLPPSPPNSPIENEKSSKAVERHYFNDLERHLLPLGENMIVLILNSTDLHKCGYATACFFSSEKVAVNFQKLLDRVASIGIVDDTLKPGYLPDVGELCLTLFSEDNSWYRGVCQRVSGQKASILYCDFGNSEVVPLERIKPIPSEVLHGVYATKCFIDGFDKSKNFMILEEYLADKNKILCNVLEGPEPNSRLISIPHLDKILSQELI
ncbi:uncharacterized protein Kots [Drosophila virilis]|uniref:Tudor domain-containing protein n=1 Tax=Drosophila virilis TaxID=7244 RepID=B4M0I6_DROVI|nr:uncharacterized protein LOC6629640 [Drosophila virilis]EDW68365.1 uncharacterized protein Dvir_GJ24667 [Drosophila virilis]